jgi:DNA topoisomerase VI subunit B
MTKLQRTTFKTSRAAQYVEARALQAMTGQYKGAFADVVVKELMDNALDATETAGVAPEITLEVEGRRDSVAGITVTDNGPGIPPETVHGALDFDVLVSDKAAYRSPTRGAQGNALKTVFGIPPALGSLEPVVVEARGLRHEARVWKDPAGELRVQCDDTSGSSSAGENGRTGGTSVTAPVPAKGRLSFEPGEWARAFALFNPHASVKIRQFDEGADHADMVNPRGRFSRILTNRPASRPRRFKYLPSDPTSAHWYDEASFARLVYSHIGHTRKEGGADLLGWRRSTAARLREAVQGALGQQESKGRV